MRRYAIILIVILFSGCGDFFGSFFYERLQNENQALLAQIKALKEQNALLKEENSALKSLLKEYKKGFQSMYE